MATNYKVYSKEKKVCFSKNAKQTLMLSPKLIISQNKKIIYELDNIQCLYLYPLNIMDYIDNLKNKNIIFINMIDINENVDYIDIFSNKKYSHLKAVELLIKEDYSNNKIDIIKNLVKFFNDRNIKITFTFQNILKVSIKIKECYKYIDFFKIYLDKRIDQVLFPDYLNEVEIVTKESKLDSLVLVKGYLDEKQALLYENMIKDFSKIKVNIFQISKELIPLGIENKTVDIKIQKLIRKLEEKYNDYNDIKFLSVRDITTLYYPRFELDIRNCRKCYACLMKPYVYKDKIIPCKVKEVVENVDKWGSSLINMDKYYINIEKCGKCCSDCASIFENDLLYKINKIEGENDKIEIYLMVE